ncbi:DUF2834 domain-containing protein [Algiphilus sp.]|uniref:DUF2834 domain-containing protein n=1 Tax=Algiphilus sp. TaxID=1872431 RepID=UPI001CA79C36|nr:DUF2834 domain-containing protein [Algiphilus sp.]MBY8966398.1 DUF2834 domain-containing protein [Algiphilus acroporae]MCI5061949.1 DUF2834 domain-containing protein [Algiphilus sp.]MCI5103241.1 DUF2834 domain-containing protein [Algiphilus sp.]MCR9090837.1 DUF2834 domain-containing protein [Pseudomonadota bacterium]
MQAKTLLLGAVLLVFGAISLIALREVGYLGIWQSGLANWGAFQVLVDLIIACALICVWMVVDARQRGANPWPFVVITLFFGAFGPLLYLLLRLRQDRGASLSAT